MTETTEAKKKYMAEYRVENKEKLKVQTNRWRESHKEESKLKQKEYYRIHGDRIRAAAVRTGKILRVKQRIAVLHHYSNGTDACVICGFSDIRALVLDHTSGGGTEHRREFKSGGNVWYWLARHGFPPGYQILCANCNTIKARMNTEYGRKDSTKADWRSQVIAFKLESKAGKKQRWEDRIKEAPKLD